MGSMLGDWGFVRGLIVGFMRLSYEGFFYDENDYLWVNLYILFLTPLTPIIIEKQQCKNNNKINPHSFPKTNQSTPQ